MQIERLVVPADSAAIAPSAKSAWDLFGNLDIQPRELVLAPYISFLFKTGQKWMRRLGFG